MVLSIDTTTSILAFLAAVLALFRPSAPAVEDESVRIEFLPDADDLLWLGDDLAIGAEEEEGGMESDGEVSADEEALDARLCTYTLTQKEFMNQHWYIFMIARCSC